MKLSEAIRIGAQSGPQAYGAFNRKRRKYFFGLLGPVVNETCALGAAWKGAGCEGKTETVKADYIGREGRVIKAGSEINAIQHPAEWNAIYYAEFDCPQCSFRDLGVHLIPHLNDDHKWTREEIAVWVERQEKVAPISYEEALELQRQQQENAITAAENHRRFEEQEKAEREKWPDVISV